MYSPWKPKAAAGAGSRCLRWSFWLLAAAAALAVALQGRQAGSRQGLYARTLATLHVHQTRRIVLESQEHPFPWQPYQAAPPPNAAAPALLDEPEPQTQPHHQQQQQQQPEHERDPQGPQHQPDPQHGASGAAGQRQPEQPRQQGLQPAAAAAAAEELLQRQQQVRATQRKVVRCLSANIRAGGGGSGSSAPGVLATYQDHERHGHVARLVPVRLWQSEKPQPQQTLTVVTALSRERLAALEAQCQSWPGPLVAVLYEPMVTAGSNAGGGGGGDAGSKGDGKGGGKSGSRRKRGSGSGGGGGSNDQPAEADEPEARRRRLMGSAGSGRDSSSTGGGGGQHGREHAAPSRRGLEQQQPAEQQHDLADTVLAVDAAFDRLERAGGAACSLSLLLATELVDGPLAEHLPINSLRNQALLLAQTPLVAVLDADMLVSRSLADPLRGAAAAEALVALLRGGGGGPGSPADGAGAPQPPAGSRRVVVVLPAFETLPYKSQGHSGLDAVMHKVAGFAQSADKPALAALMASGLLGVFNAAVNLPGQAETDVQRWLAFEPGGGSNAAGGGGASNININITYSISPKHAKFEPWYIMDRQDALAHPYDEAFRGYGKNKIQHRLWLSALGHRFLVHGAAFIVHRPHAESGAKKAWRGQLAGGRKGGPLNAARLERLLRGPVEDGSYRPSLAPAAARCLREARARHEGWRAAQQRAQQQREREHAGQPGREEEAGEEGAAAAQEQHAEEQLLQQLQREPDGSAAALLHSAHAALGSQASR